MKSYKTLYKVTNNDILIEYKILWTIDKITREFQMI